jgi:hypothetical protein
MIDKSLTDGRHRAVADAARWLDSSHLSPELHAIAMIFEDAGADFLTHCKAEDPMVTHTLNALVRAKDCAVRAKIAEGGPTAT